MYNVLIIALCLLGLVGFFALVLYVRFLADKKVNLKLVCPVCSAVYNPDESYMSEVRKEKICAKCRADELNKREIGE
ncbi:MAG: hypothetical protein HYW34_01355 [Candidatus Brennerbacteria bacterium]|nr:hypothetical protein [Candidatus Brennerbacteria bacterium]